MDIHPNFLKRIKSEPKVKIAGPPQFRWFEVLGYAFDYLDTGSAVRFAIGKIVVEIWRWFTFFPN